MTEYVFDPSATLAANLIPPEFHDVSLEKNRFFVPAAGLFYADGVVVRNFANNTILQPIIDYVMYEIDRTTTKDTGHPAYLVMAIVNPAIIAITMSYHAVGGLSQYTATHIDSILGAYITGASDQYPWGNISLRPIAYPPELHLEDIDNIYDAERLVLAVNNISESILSGDKMATSQVYQYMDLVAQEYVDQATQQINDLADRVNAFVGAATNDVGTFILTDNPANPAIRRGVGQYVLNPDILLLGTALGTNTIGDLVPLALGSDINARRCYIWQQVTDVGQISYTLSASANSVNEGQSVVFTLTTTGITSGAQIPYKITGTNVFQAVQIAPTPINGYFTIGPDGTATMVVTVTADFQTEGNRTFTIAIVAMPSVNASVVINDTSLSPGVTMAWSANADGSGSTQSAVNEGSTVYLVLTGINMPPGTVCNLDYSLGSAAQRDFTSTLPTSVTFDTNVRIIRYDVWADRITEGNRTFAVGLTSQYITTPLVASITIIDTSLSPTYNMYFSSASNGSGTITSVNEGATAYMVVQTTNVDPGTVFNLTYTGTMSDAAFTAPRAATVTIDSSGKGIVAYGIIADHLTEGNRVLSIILSQSGTQLVTGSLTVLDTSQNPTYASKFTTAADGSTAALTSANEGDSIYFALFTTSVDPGTQYDITATGSVNQTRLSTTLPVSMTTDSTGKATAILTFLQDHITEGATSLTLNVYAHGTTTLLTTATITLNDTSINPSYSATWSLSTSGAPVVTNVNEGQTVYLVFTVTNPIPGMVLQLAIDPTSSVDATRFTTAPPTTIAINSSGYGYAAYTLRNDATTEGLTTLVIKARYSGAVVWTAPINVNDTSRLPVSAVFTSDGATPMSSVNEGAGGYLTLTSPAFTRGGTFALTFSGMSDLSKLQILGAGAVVVGVGSFTYTPISFSNTTTGVVQIPFSILPDFITTGARTLQVVVSAQESGSLSATTANAYITINDTSTAPNYTMYYATDVGGTNPVTAANVNTQCYLIVKSPSAPNGTVVAVTFDKSLMVSSYRNPPTNTNVTLNGGIGAIAIDLSVY